MHLFLFATTVSLCSPGWPQISSYLGLPNAGTTGTGHDARLVVRFFLLLICTLSCVWNLGCLCPYLVSTAGESPRVTRAPDSVRVSETQQKWCHVRTSPPVRTASGLSLTVSCEFAHGCLCVIDMYTCRKIYLH